MSEIDQITEQQIMEMITAGNKIAAIKLYRERTGASLAEAKAAVEAMRPGVFVETTLPSQPREPDLFLENQIKRLLTERKKIEAVKAYREAYHCGLKEAKDAVDLIQAGMNKEGYSSMPVTPAISNDPFAEDAQRNRSRLVLILAFLLVAIGVVAFFFLRGTGF
jgi:ribosomal protein L7/L12